MGVLPRGSLNTQNSKKIYDEIKEYDKKYLKDFTKEPPKEKSKQSSLEALLKQHAKENPRPRKRMKLSDDSLPRKIKAPPELPRSLSSKDPTKPAPSKPM